MASIPGLHKHLKVRALNSTSCLYPCFSLGPTQHIELPPYWYNIFYCKRAILFLSSSKILTPPPHPPLRTASLSSPPQQRRGYTLAGRRGEWGVIFWKTREIGLSSYSKICTLCPVLARPIYHKTLDFKDRENF